MSHQDFDYHAYGAGGSYHPLEDVGGFGSFEKGALLTLVFFPIVIFQFLVLLLTPIGMMLGASGAMNKALYGPFTNPVFTLLAGVAAWWVLRLIRLLIIRLCGGGLIPRSELYRRGR